MRRSAGLSLRRCLGGRFPSAAHPGWASQESWWPQGDLHIVLSWLCKKGEGSTSPRGIRAFGEEKEAREKRRRGLHGKLLWIINNVMALSAFYLPAAHSPYFLPLLLFTLHTLKAPDWIGLGVFSEAVKDDTGCRCQGARCGSRSPCVCLSVCQSESQLISKRIWRKSIGTRWTGVGIHARTF